MRELFTAADALTDAIDNMTSILSEAREYLANRNDLAACGALTRFEDISEDLKAAIRLHRSATRRAT